MMAQSEHLKEWRHANYNKRKDEINANRRADYALKRDEKNKIRREKYNANKDGLNEKRRKDYQVHKPRILEECHRHYEKHKPEISNREKNKYQRNKEHVKKRTNKYYHANKDEVNKKRMETRISTYSTLVLPLKQDVMTHYGKDGKCACVMCGISDIRVLTIDHVNGDGYKDRQGKCRLRGYSLYNKIKRDNYPKNLYQTLCFNCQHLKQITNHEYSNHKMNTKQKEGDF